MDKRKKFMAGMYYMPPPPVSANLWTVNDWINYIDSKGFWLRGRCNQCNKKVAHIFSDGRCKNCTHIEGEIMTDKYKSEVISAVIADMKERIQAKNARLVEHNLYDQQEAFDEGDMFLKLAFMSDWQISKLAEGVFGKEEV